jgi:hypothetical protein
MIVNNFIENNKQKAKQNDKKMIVYMSIDEDRP